MDNGLTRMWHGAPVWVWAAGAGIVGVIGLYVLKGRKAAASSSGSGQTSYLVPSQSGSSWAPPYNPGGYTPPGSSGGGSGGSTGGLTGAGGGGNEVTGAAATTASPSILGLIKGAVAAPTPGANVYGPAGYSFVIGPGTGPNGIFVPADQAQAAAYASQQSAESAGLLSPGTAAWRKQAGLA